MPLQRAGRYVVATPGELNHWLGREAGGEPLHVATPEADLSAKLKRGLTFGGTAKLAHETQCGSRELDTAEIVRDARFINNGTNTLRGATSSVSFT
jgi:hypothetical protein